MTFQLVDDRLRFYPQEELEPLERNLLTAHKADLIALLQAEAEATAETPAVTPGWECAAFDPFGPEMPSVTCPVCGAQDWFRAGDGWTCSTCHPPPERPTDESNLRGREADAA